MPLLHIWNLRQTLLSLGVIASMRDSPYLVGSAFGAVISCQGWAVDMFLADDGLISWLLVRGMQAYPFSCANFFPKTDRWKWIINGLTIYNMGYKMEWIRIEQSSFCFLYH